MDVTVQITKIDLKRLDFDLFVVGLRSCVKRMCHRFISSIRPYLHENESVLNNAANN